MMGTHHALPNRSRDEVAEKLMGFLIIRCGKVCLRVRFVILLCFLVHGCVSVHPAAVRRQVGASLSDDIIKLSD